MTISKEERRKEILLEIKEIVRKTGVLRYNRYALETELDHIRGHFDKSWEETYQKKEPTK